MPREGQQNVNQLPGTGSACKHDASSVLLTLVPAPPGLPAVFVSVWASVRASLADTQYVDPPSAAVLLGGKDLLQMLAKNLWAPELLKMKIFQKEQEE